MSPLHPTFPSLLSQLQTEPAEWRGKKNLRKSLSLVPPWAELRGRVEDSRIEVVCASQQSSLLYSILLWQSRIQEQPSLEPWYLAASKKKKRQQGVWGAIILLEPSALNWSSGSSWLSSPPTYAADFELAHLPIHMSQFLKIKFLSVYTKPIESIS